MDRLLVGRDAESARLHGWLSDRVSGVPAAPALFVTGEAGVGKTALVEAALGSRRDVGIYRAAAAPWQERPFALIRDLLEDAGADSTHDIDRVRDALIAFGRPSWSSWMICTGPIRHHWSCWPR